MNSAKKLLTNTILLTLSTVIIRSVAMGFQVYISNLIGAEGIGIFTLVMSVYYLALTIGSSGVRVASTCLIAEEFGYNRPAGVRKAVNHCLAYGLVCSVVTAIAVFFLSDYLGRVWIGDERAVLPLQVSAFCIPLSVLSSVMAGYFTASGKIGRYVVLEFFERGFSIVATVFLLGILAPKGIPYSCASVIAGSGIATALSFFILYGLYFIDIVKVRPTTMPMARRLFGMALPLAGNEYVRSGLSTLEHMLIPRGLKNYGDGESQALASYGTIHGMVFPVITFPTAILYSVADILIPELSSCRAANRPNRITYIVSHVMQLSFVFAALCCAILYSTGTHLGILIYGSPEASVFFRTFAPLVIFIYLDTIVDGMLKGLGQQVYNVRLNTCTSALDVVLLVLLLPRFGIDGYIAAFAVTKLINFGFSIAKIVMVTGYMPRPLLILKVVLSIAAAFFVTSIVLPAGVAASILTQVLIRSFLTAAIFLALVFMTRAVSGEDLKWLMKLFGYKKG